MTEKDEPPGDHIPNFSNNNNKEPNNHNNKEPGDEDWGLNVYSPPTSDASHILGDSEDLNFEYRVKKIENKIIEGDIKTHDGLIAILMKDAVDNDCKFNDKYLIHFLSKLIKLNSYDYVLIEKLFVPFLFHDNEFVAFKVTTYFEKIEISGNLNSYMVEARSIRQEKDNFFNYTRINSDNVKTIVDLHVAILQSQYTLNPFWVFLNGNNFDNNRPKPRPVSSYLNKDSVNPLPDNSNYVIDCYLNCVSVLTPKEVLNDVVFPLWREYDFEKAGEIYSKYILRNDSKVKKSNKEK